MTALILAMMLGQSASQAYVLTTNASGGVSIVPAVTDGGYSTFSYTQGSGLTDGGSWPMNIVGTVPVTGTFWQTTQPVSLAANQSTNVAQVAGTTTDIG